MKYDDHVELRPAASAKPAGAQERIMKRLRMASVALLSGGLLLAQSQPQGQTSTPQQPVAPAAQQPAEPQVPKGKTPPAAKTQAEVEAYNQVVALARQKNAAGAEQAADSLAAKFKDSELRYLAYYQVMMAYQEQNNAAKAIDMGRKVLALNPNEPVTLAMVGSYISEQIRDSDLDRDDRVKEAMQDAQKSLQLVDTELVIPAGVSQQSVDENKALLRSIAYGAIGNLYLVKSDYSHAEENLKQAVTLAPVPGDAVTWLRYAVALDMQNKLKEAMAAVNKAVELAPAGSVQAKMAQDERQRLIQRGGSALSKSTAPSSAAPGR